MDAPTIWAHIEGDKLICGYFWEDHPLMALSGSANNIEDYIIDAVESCEQAIQIDKDVPLLGPVCAIAPSA